LRGEKDRLHRPIHTFFAAKKGPIFAAALLSIGSRLPDCWKRDRTDDDRTRQSRCRRRAMVVRTPHLLG
jgi:hypothetical protein